MADELDAPLGKKASKTAARKSRGGSGTRADTARAMLQRLPITRVLFGLLAFILIAVAARIIFVDDPDGGRPVSEVAISTTRGNNQIANQVASDPPVSAPAVAGSTTTQPIEGGPDIITVGDDVPDSVGISELTEFGVLPELVENTQNGPIPRVADNGDTAFETYARAAITPETADGRPLIALVVTGMGLNDGATRDAINKLPDNITLAFAPYGRTLQQTTSAARAGGHEIMLEIPLEPFDYPENDPGPQTLLTGQSPRANLDRLYWLLARMGGYTGVINHMGARFTSSATDFGPIMEEIATRGLGYFDDGGSNRSVAGVLAGSNRVPFASSDILIDATPSRVAILEALGKLEAKAETSGQAIGVATALPISIQTIADWARELEEKGILLVPASALMTRP